MRFEPTTARGTLQRHRVDRSTIVCEVRVQAVQTRTAAPIVSNEEIHSYEVAEVDGVYYVSARHTARQIVLIAGRNLLLEKASQFSEFHVNDDGALATREMARRGERIMYRDTEKGVRYLVKQGDTRVVSERSTTRAKAMAIGVLVDPSFAFPLPIFGINYLDFEVAGRSDTQFALLFGGVLAAGNLQRPKIGGTPLDASVDFFGIAVPASDRLYSADGEADERLLTWPLSAGVNLGWQYTAFQKAAFQYQLRYDAFIRDRTTAESFVVPSRRDPRAWSDMGISAGGYSAVMNGTWSGALVGAVGTGRGARDRRSSYVKYAAHISKDVFLSTFQKVHLNAAYFGGHRLDRFSRYQFGLFDDTRIHGVPASGLRFDDVVMARGSYSFNIFEQYRLDLSWIRHGAATVAPTAVGNRSPDSAWRSTSGAVQHNSSCRRGKGFLPERYHELGSLVFQVMILKPLR